MKVCIRADASAEIGTGHVMRCLTLAMELRSRGDEVIFVCRELPGNLCDFLEEKGFNVARLPAAVSQFSPEGAPLHARWLGVSCARDMGRDPGSTSPLPPRLARGRSLWA